MKMRKPLKFSNGKFRILQISDLQDTKNTNPDTLQFVHSALSELKPDLIVITGDQLDVFTYWGKGDKKYKNVETAIKRLFSVFEQFDIPYVLTFGNHDCETGVTNEEQAKIYSQFSNCICFDRLDDGRPDAGTFNIEILSEDESRTALNLYVIDSGTKLKIGDYGCVAQNKIDWCISAHKELKEKNAGNAVPSIVFQHIPVYEIYHLLKKVKRFTKKSLPAYNARKGEYYILDDDKVFQKGTFRETPASPGENKHQLEQMRDNCDVFAMYFGHDHYNSFAGKTDGVDLGYCAGTGFNPYGIPNRGMRVFDFDENDVTGYKTKVVSYKDVCKKPYIMPLRHFIYSNIPSSPHAVPAFALKWGSIGLGLLAIWLLVFFLISKSFAITALGVILGFSALYAVSELLRNKLISKKLFEDTEDE